MKVLQRISILLVIIIAGAYAGWFFLLAPVGGSSEPSRFIIPKDQSNFDLTETLSENGLIKSPWAFQIILGIEDVKSGAYYLSKTMNTFEIVKKLSGEPDFVWVTITSCQRKEQIGEALAEKLHWSEEQLAEWNNLYAKENTEYYEGVYYPDTYLIAVDSSVPEAAQKFIDQFNTVFEPFADQYAEKNIKWTTGLKIASLIERETDQVDQMPLVSAIIWNRLNIDMPLQIDSTMQYTEGKDADGNWWGPINIDERLSESPYNSYLHTGLPPTPICSPGVDAIDAALNPVETECLYYLHAPDKTMHCAKTYEEHLVNIEKYLQ